MSVAPCTSQRITRSRQKAKKGARLASCAAKPANLSKKPILLETSLGMRSGDELWVIVTPFLSRIISASDPRLHHLPPGRTEGSCPISFDVRPVLDCCCPRCPKERQPEGSRAAVPVGHGCHRCRRHLIAVRAESGQRAGSFGQIVLATRRGEVVVPALLVDREPDRRHIWVAQLKTRRALDVDAALPRRAPS